jgi:hypothetical protein
MGMLLRLLKADERTIPLLISRENLRYEPCASPRVFSERHVGEEGGMVTCRCQSRANMMYVR